VHLQYDRFWFKNNPQRRVFAGRHLEAGQYVAQSGLHLHKTEPHSCKGGKKEQFSELPNIGLFTFSLISSSIAFNKVYCGNRYRYNICKLQETNFADIRYYMIKILHNFKNLFPNKCAI
jgi:hypothetical protein